MLAAALAGVVPSGAAPARPLAATTGCVGVDGGSVPSGGPHRATVVVDAGSGAVWSACVSFSGSISGIEALTRAEAVIADLDPVFDQYTGLGKAVCKLRGVGSDPPDCLGKSVSYWSYSHNGAVARVGAGSVTVNDGDVDGWRYGTGGTPRAATNGTKATSVVATTTTTRPATTTTAPRATTTTSRSGGLTGGPGEAPTTTAARATTTSGQADEADTGDPAGTTDPESAGSTTSAGAADGSADDGATTDSGSADDPATSDGEEGATAASTTAGSTITEVDDQGSSVGSILGFGGAIAALACGGIVVRRRRSAVSPG